MSVVKYYVPEDFMPFSPSAKWDADPEVGMDIVRAISRKASSEERAVTGEERERRSPFEVVIGIVLRCMDTQCRFAHRCAESSDTTVRATAYWCIRLAIHATTQTNGRNGQTFKSG